MCSDRLETAETRRYSRGQLLQALDGDVREMNRLHDELEDARRQEPKDIAEVRAVVAAKNAEIRRLKDQLKAEV